MNGCKFLREKGQELEWNHTELFPYFKSKIAPFMVGVKDSCRDMLQFFDSIRSYELSLTASVERHYELFIDIYHYQQFIDIDSSIVPPIEVQLMWISHCLNPVEYYRDCQAKYKKILDVNIISCSDNDIPHLNEFFTYLNNKLNPNVFAAITRNTPTCTNTNEAKDSWFIHNLHMKNSIYQQMELINKLNLIQVHKRISDRDIYKAMHRYYKFLYIMALPTDKRPPICVPTLDIDLIWHSHILKFKHYYAMSRYLFPQIEIIPHNHTTNPTQNNRNKQLTQIFWNKIFMNNDYLNGRAFYIIYNNNKHNIKKSIPLPPIALQTISEDKRTFKITRRRSAEDTKDTEATKHRMGEISVQETDINTQMLMEGETEGNCCLCCSLYVDCCRWTFLTHQRLRLCIICGLIICVVFALLLFGAFLFIPTLDNAVTVNLYQNNVVINADWTVTFNSLIVYSFNNIFDDDIYISMAYNIDGIQHDIISFEPYEPYLKDNGYYYVDIELDSVKDEIRFNYTLSSSYFCCNDVLCNDIGLMMPWINVNQWKEFNMNIYYANITGLDYIVSDSEGYVKDEIFVINTNINTNLNVYFKLLKNETMDYRMEQCNEEYYSMEYEKEDDKQIMVTIEDYILISVSTILLMGCACYGFCWMMYLFRNSFF